MSEKGAMQGVVVCWAGEFPTFDLNRLQHMVEAEGGIWQKSHQNVHIVVCGDDAGGKPADAKRVNPSVQWMSYERLYNLINKHSREGTCFIPQPILPTNLVARPAAYGSF